MRVRVAVINAGSMGMDHLGVLKDFNKGKIQLIGIIEVYDEKCITPLLNILNIYLI